MLHCDNISSSPLPSSGKIKPKKFKGLGAEGPFLDNRGVRTATGPKGTERKRKPGEELDRIKWARVHILQDLFRSKDGSKSPAFTVCGLSAFKAEEVGVSLTPQDRLQTSGTCSCKNPHMCPTCSVAAVVKRQGETAALAEACLKDGGTLVMGVLTVQHDHSDRLVDLRALLMMSSQSATNSRAFRAKADAVGLVNVVYGDEATWGFSSGWHYHRHFLLFCRSSDEAACKALGDLLVQGHIAYVRKHGGEANWQAQDVQIVRSAVEAAKYVAKDAAWETVGGSVTKSRAKGYVLGELIDLAGTGDDRFCALVREFYGAMKGTRTCRIPKTLWDAFPKAREFLEREAKAEVAQREKQPSRLLGVLSCEVWNGLVLGRHVAEFRARMGAKGEAWEHARYWAVRVTGPEAREDMRTRVPERFVSAETLATQVLSVRSGGDTAAVLRKAVAAMRRKAERFGVKLVLPDLAEVARLIAQ